MHTTYIIGAGGLGAAIAEQYNKQEHSVVLLSKRQQVDTSYKVINIDYLNQDHLDQFLSDNKLPDELIITTGILHDGNNQPEKAIAQLSKEWLLENIEYNLMPSLIALKAVTRLLKRNQSIKVACFSARVSSISDNRLGGWHSYRMSKAALNMLVKNTAIEWQFKSPNSTVITYHPGTVATRLSEPFQKNVTKEKLFTAEQAAQYFFNVFESVKPDLSGRLLDWQGEVVEY